MPAKRAKIKARLEEVMESLLCPVSGCWCLHGGHYEYYYDEGCECHVLEVWPIGFQEPVDEEGNGREQDENDICYELAEFEFGGMVKEVPLEHLHFSQHRQMFEHRVERIRARPGASRPYHAGRGGVRVR